MQVNRKLLFLAVAIAIALFTVPGSAQAATTIDTSIYGASEAGPFGEGFATPTQGQTFRTPNDTDVVLQDWTIWLKSFGEGTLDFRFGIAVWDGTKAGSVLYLSDKTSATLVGVPEQFTFTPNVTLTPGQDYVAFFTASLDMDGAGRGSIYITGDTYAGGKWVFANNGADYAALSTTPWWVAAGSDTKFKATFVPAVVTIPVDVDVMPGTDPNLLNCKSKGVLPVAVLGSADFDVATVDTTTVALGDPELTGTASPVKFSYADVNLDGLTDLVLHFSMPALVANGALNASSLELFLTGETIDGDEVVGSDVVVVR